jgi:hypothetical protein
MKNSKFIAALVLAGITAVATAQTNSPPNGGNGQGGGQGSGERRGPPPQAIEACKGKSSGAPCSFVGHNNNEPTGTCFSPNTDHPLACRPEHGNNHQAGQGKEGHE